MERYFAREENGKGYLYDSRFSERVPIAVETTFSEARRKSDFYNRHKRGIVGRSVKHGG